MGNCYHYGILSGGKVIHGGGGEISCDIGFNSPTEKVAENIVIYGKYWIGSTLFQKS